MRISGQNILGINKGNPHWKMCGDKGQVQQYNQDNRRGPDLVEYAMWKLDTKSVAWMSSDIGIYLDLSLVSSYSSQITLYKSLHACQ